MNTNSNRSVVYNNITTGLTTDTSNTVTFTVEDDGLPFRATLGWTDYPGLEVYLGTLVNDLDLRVKSPDGTWIYPDNARNLGVVERVHDIVEAGAIELSDRTCGLKLRPSTGYTLLDSVWVCLGNDGGDTTPINLVVYDWVDGAVGPELYRQKIDYLSSATHLLPIGIPVTGCVVVAVELGNSELIMGGLLVTLRAMDQRRQVRVG